MTVFARFRLSTPQARQNASRACLEAPEGLDVEIREPKRSNPQNDRLHALLADLVRGMPFYAGEAMDIDDWKAVMVLALDKHEGRVTRAVPGLEGGVVALRRSTTRMSKAEVAKLIEYCEVFMTKNGIAIRDTRYAA